MRTAIALSTILLAAASAAEAGDASFATKPTAVKDGEKAKIAFAVNRECDVAVYVENARGEIVRHLVAGILAKNPPEPLKANSLEQAIEWDGNDDDGKPAAGAPFKVRVGLGLRAGWGGTAFSDQAGPNHLTSVHGLAGGGLDVQDGPGLVLLRVGEPSAAFGRELDHAADHIGHAMLEEPAAQLAVVDLGKFLGQGVVPGKDSHADVNAPFLVNLHAARLVRNSTHHGALEPSLDVTAEFADLGFPAREDVLKARVPAGRTVRVKKPSQN